jgi:hypothetical protein
MKFWLIAYTLLLIMFLIFNPEPKDNCSHLTGTDYDRCHVIDVKGR